MGNNGGMGTRGAIFVLPVTTAGQLGPVAAWVSTAGWAVAARRVLGDAWIVSPSGVLDPDDVRRRGTHPTLAAPAVPGWRRRVPTVAKTAVKDVRQWRRGRAFRVEQGGPWDASELAFVWQRHDLFQRAGLDLARRLGVPSVLFVPAPLVWEAAAWGVARPGWSRALERFGEQPSLRRADLVAAGSEAVATQLRRLGVADERIIITPTGVDLDLFAPRAGASLQRERLGIHDRFVVGWVGSFRRFHACEQAVEALAGIEGATLLLVGDGPERPRIEALARRHGVDAVFTGTVPHSELPELLGAMDVALVLSAREQAFHYSPLKLAEYLAAGLPVVAPAVAQLEERLTDDVDAVLTSPGDVAALAHALRRLRADPTMRARIGDAARETAARTWSWDHQIRRVLTALERSAPPAADDPLLASERRNGPARAACAQTEDG